MRYVLVNNEVKKTAETNLSNFLWDCPCIFSEKIWFGYGGIPLLSENLETMKKQLAFHGFEQPPLFRQPRELFRLCKRTLNKNKYFRSGLLVFQLFANSQHTQLLVTPKPREIFDFPLSPQGLMINISGLQKNTASLQQQYIINNHSIWQAAKHQLKHSSCSNAVILNNKNYVCEGIGSNIFLVKDGILITPSPEAGCYIDILRRHIVSLAATMNMKVVQSDEIPKEMLFAADEIFLVSEAGGIEWVLGIDSKRFIHTFSQALHEQINALLKQKANPQ